MNRAFAFLFAIAAAQASERVIFVGCDVSASVWNGSQSGPNPCDADLARILETMHPKDTLFLWLISDKGLLAGSPAITFTYRPYDPFKDRRREYDQAVVEKKELARRTLNELLQRTKPSDGTDILMFFQAVSQVARGYLNTVGKEVFVLSDGVHEAKVNFRRMSLSDEEIQQFVEKERRAGRLPEGLKGAHVSFVTGAYIQDSRYYDSEKLLRVEAAWRVFIPAAGGVVQNYGPVLVLSGGK